MLPFRYDFQIQYSIKISGLVMDFPVHKVKLKDFQSIKFFLLFIMLVFISYYSIDAYVSTLFSHVNHDSLVKQIAHFVSTFGKGHWYIVPALVGYVIFKRNMPHLSKSLLFIFTTTVVSGVIVNILKVIFARPRPELFFNEQIFSFQWFQIDRLFSSFPSAHSTTAIGAWLAIVLVIPSKFRWFFIIPGIFIAFSRVILTAHYISDILAGAYLGAMVTLFLYPYMMQKKVLRIPSLKLNDYRKKQKVA